MTRTLHCRHLSSQSPPFVTFRRHLSSLSSLFVTIITCRYCHHFSSLSPPFVTVATFRHSRHFWVVITFVAFLLPLRVAFASTLIYDPSHNLREPCSTQEARMECLHFFGRHFSSLFVTVATCFGCDAFFTFLLPRCVAFAPTLIYDPSHNLHDPCSTHETRM